MLTITGSDINRDYKQNIVLISVYSTYVFLTLLSYFLLMRVPLQASMIFGFITMVLLPPVIIPMIGSFFRRDADLKLNSIYPTIVGTIFFVWYLLLFGVILMQSPTMSFSLPDAAVMVYIYFLAVLPVYAVGFSLLVRHKTKTSLAIKLASLIITCFITWLVISLVGVGP